MLYLKGRVLLVWNMYRLLHPNIDDLDLKVLESLLVHQKMAVPPVKEGENFLFCQFFLLGSDFNFAPLSVHRVHLPKGKHWGGTEKMFCY